MNSKYTNADKESFRAYDEINNNYSKYDFEHIQSCFRAGPAKILTPYEADQHYNLVGDRKGFSKLNNAARGIVILPIFSGEHINCDIVIQKLTPLQCPYEIYMIAVDKSGNTLSRRELELYDIGHILEDVLESEISTTLEHSRFSIKTEEARNHYANLFRENMAKEVELTIIDEPQFIDQFIKARKIEHLANIFDSTDVADFPELFDDIKAINYVSDELRNNIDKHGMYLNADFIYNALAGETIGSLYISTDDIFEALSITKHCSAIYDDEFEIIIEKDGVVHLYNELEDELENIIENDIFVYKKQEFNAGENCLQVCGMYLYDKERKISLASEREIIPEAVVEPEPDVKKTRTRKPGM